MYRDISLEGSQLGHTQETTAPMVGVIYYAVAVCLFKFECDYLFYAYFVKCRCRCSRYRVD